MKRLKGLYISILVLVFIAAFVVIRSGNNELFREDTGKAIQDAAGNRIYISENELEGRSEEFTVIILGNPGAAESRKNVHHVPLENLLDTENRKLLDETTGIIVLQADQVAVTARAWTLLNQLGYTKVLILRQDESAEVFQYTFQPDSTVSG